MGSIFNRQINGVQFQIVAESWSTRNSWGHKATIYQNGHEINAARARYYNRTWEGYQYQTVIRKAIYNELQAIEARTVEAWKEENNRHRILKDQRAEILRQSNEYQTARALLNSF